MVPVSDGVDGRKCWKFPPRLENKGGTAIVADLLLLGIGLLLLVEWPALIVPLEEPDVRLHSEVALADVLEVGEDDIAVRTDVVRLELVEFQHIQEELRWQK